MSCGAECPVIFGCTGLTLEADEKAFFKDSKPAGFILFQKNCDNPQQVKKLTSELRDYAGWNAPILIDQEGGRVQRLKPPHWQNFPAPKIFGDLYKTDKGKALDACTKAVKGLADAQLSLGIDVDCIPVLDVVPENIGTRAIDDRAFASDPQIVANLGMHTCKVAIDCGMTPVMKHLPGHGRAKVDSHKDLPCVDTDRAVLQKSDWMPFAEVTKAIDNATIWAMTAHVIYTDIDPDLPGTISPTIIRDVIRGTIGFEGLLVTDDLFMDALAPFGDVPKRAALALKAGCDLALHCHGTVADRERAAAAVPVLGTHTRSRLDAWHKNRI